MGIFQGDVIIKSMVDLGMAEMRKNLWLLDHAFESLKATPYISDKYGQNNIDAAKEWLTNNEIDVYMRPRNDKDRLPMVTIFPGASNEKPDMRHLGDRSAYKKILLPNEIGKPIPYIVKPFVPTGYDQSTGQVGVPAGTVGLNTVVPGQVLVDPTNGNGYVIQGTYGGGIIIESGLALKASQLGVVPKYQFYEARIRHTYNDETYSIGCYAHGDPQTLVWLHTIVLTAILRYRQTLLEVNGFAECIVSSGEIMEDPNYTGPNGESAYCRFITIQGQVEQSWIDAPKRFIESVVLETKEDGQFTSGIKIISNLDAPPFLNPTQESWTTVEDTPDETEDDFDEDDGDIR